jgi:hypothetical protein
MAWFSIRATRMKITHTFFSKRIINIYIHLNMYTLIHPKSVKEKTRVRFYDFGYVRYFIHTMTMFSLFFFFFFFLNPAACRV